MKSGELDGKWDHSVGEYDYQEYANGDVTVRFHPGYEPDGELVTTAPVSVHLERMGAQSWSLILTDAAGNETHVDLWSKSAISVLWREERMPEALPA